MTIEVPRQGMEAIGDFLLNRTEPLPDDVRDKLIQATRQPSAVNGSFQAVELIYSRKADLAEAPTLLAIAAELAVVMNAHHLMGLDEDNRGMRISSALLREADMVPEGITPQAAEDDPPAHVDFAPPPAPLPPGEAGAPPVPPPAEG